VFWNLLSNGVKFTPRGGTVRIAAMRVGPDLEISVADTGGIGIAAHQQSLIFAPFVQADGSMTRRYAGTGLGLTICRKLVHSLGGELQLESAPGWGTRFFFEIELPSVRRA